MDSPRYTDNGQHSNIKFKIHYSVKKLSSSVTKEYELIRNEAIEVATYRSNRDFHENSDAIIDATELSYFFDRLHQEFKDSSNNKYHPEQVYTIFIINPPRHTSEYTYATSKKSAYGSYIFVGTGRWIVADTQAKKTSLNAKGARGGVLNLSVDNPLLFQLELSNLCKLAVQKVFTSHLQDRDVRTATNFIIPIIVFQNHNLWSPWVEGTSGLYKEAPINEDEIEREVSKMFLWPEQSHQIITASHGLHEHKQISIALYNSLRTRTKVDKVKNKITSVHREYYFDSDTLRFELSRAADILGSLNLFDSQKETRVLPVYVFSIAGIEKSLFLEDYQLVTATQDSVIVLQTNETQLEVPFTDIKGQSIKVNAMTGAERNIIAGISMALGGIVSPLESLSRRENNLTFSAGFHPYGYFSDSNIVSTVFTDSIIRNQIISRTDNLIFRTQELVKTLKSFIFRYRLMASKPYTVDHSDNLLMWVDAFDNYFGDRENFKAFVNNVRGDIIIIKNDIALITEYMSEYEMGKALRLALTFESRIKSVEKKFIDKLILLDLEFHCVHLNQSLGHTSLGAIIISLILTISLCAALFTKCLPDRTLTTYRYNRSDVPLAASANIPQNVVYDDPRAVQKQTLGKID